MYGLNFPDFSTEKLPVQSNFISPHASKVIRDSIHLQKLEIDSNASKDDIFLGSGDSRRKVTSTGAREVILSHRNIHESKSSKRNRG